MRNRNLVVIGIAILLIVLVAVLAMLPQEKLQAEPGATVAHVAPAVPEQTEKQAAADEPTADEKTAELADAYLLVTVDGTLYEPIPLYEDGEYTIRRANGSENTIHVTPDSVYMKSSTCDNQDCVLQGTVSLENKYERVLGNMIICLPNEITLELFTPQELVQVLVNE